MQPSYQPNSSPNKQQRAWTTGSAFDTLGWSPDGAVRGMYSVMTLSTDFMVNGMCDVDGDGMLAIYNAGKTQNPAMYSTANTY